MPKIHAALTATIMLIVQPLPVTPTWSATFDATRDPKSSCSAIEITGELAPGDYDIFVSAFKKAQAIAPVRRLYLNSGGGNLLAALAITEFLRNLAPAVETIVAPQRVCYSACVIILTVGSRRHVSSEASLLVHQAFDHKTGKPDAPRTREVGEYLVRNGMPAEAMTTLSNLAPDEQLAITASNAKRLGFGSFIFYGGTNPPATPSCNWEGFILNSR